MTTGTFPDAWEEVCLVTIQKKAGTAYQYAAINETVDISEPDYPGESVMTSAGGRLWKQSAQEDGEVTLELYPIGLDTTASQGLFQEFIGGTWDTSQPLASDIVRIAGVFSTGDVQRDRFMIAIMWTDDIAQTSAVAATTTSAAVGLRFYAKECRIISHKVAFTDGILKATVTLKFPAMNKAGTARNYAWESTNDGAGTPLPALTYT